LASRTRNPDPTKKFGSGFNEPNAIQLRSQNQKNVVGSLKGQLNSLDLMLAIVIFVFLLSYVVLFRFVDVLDLDKSLTKNKLEADALSLSDILLKSQGVPYNWEKNSSNVQMIGLASSPNVLNSEKLQMFTNMSYINATQLLGLSSQFYFYVEDLEENRLYETGNSTLSDQIISITRFAILNGEKVRVRLIVYE